MKNFVCAYNFRDKNIQKKFEDNLKKIYPEGIQKIQGDLPHYAFKARELAEAEENIGGFLTSLRAGDPDVVAIYYNRVSEPDIIKRSLIFGQENRLDSLLNELRAEDHTDMISELLGRNLVEG